MGHNMGTETGSGLARRDAGSLAEERSGNSLAASDPECRAGRAAEGYGNGTETCLESITGILEGKAAEIAKNLDLPIGFEDKPFILPQGPYLLCKIERENAKAASLGSNGGLRIDGSFKLTVGALLGDNSGKVREIAEAVAAQVPRGLGLEYDGNLGTGEIVFKTPEILEPKTDAGRMNVDVSFGFCAVIFKP